MPRPAPPPAPSWDTRRCRPYDCRISGIALADLRRRHPRLTYDSYSITSGPELRIVFQFTLEPDVIFRPEIRIPNPGPLPKAADLERLVFHLGLVEAISYWKAACPPQFVVRAGGLSEDQKAWWTDLFIHGLGEFFYTNGIDFTSREFLTIVSDAGGDGDVRTTTQTAGSLVLSGGGKDSAVTLELLRNSAEHIGALVLNPIEAACSAVEVAGYPGPILVKRTIDPKLLELNAAGYLNGHTPFSAYLAFLGVLVGVLHGYRNVIVSNERSAGEENVMFHGMHVNHQYSKSLRFEARFRQYAARYLTADVEYYSFLRPLYDLRCTQLFSRYPRHHLSFRSCNVNQKLGSWCGRCAKCAFVYVSLVPFVGYEQALRIFGGDFLADDTVAGHLRAMTGVELHKPFECVGTVNETILALYLTVETYGRSGIETPDILKELQSKLNLSPGAVHQLAREILGSWSPDHYLPASHEEILHRAHRDVPVQWIA